MSDEPPAGHLNAAGTFVNPPGGSSLIQLRAIAAPIQERLHNPPLDRAASVPRPRVVLSLFPPRAIAAPIQERLDNAPLDNIRTFRTSLNLIGDGFVEAIANDTLTATPAAQPAPFRGTPITAPVVEANGALRIRRLGW